MAASRTEAGVEAQKSKPKGKFGLPWLWAGVLIAPCAFLSNLQANYTLTQMLCPGGRMLVLHLTTLIFLLISATGGLIAWRNWRRGAAGEELPADAVDRRTRSRFMGALGLMLSALCSLIIIAQWIPQFIFNPCQR